MQSPLLLASSLALAAGLLAASPAARAMNPPGRVGPQRDALVVDVANVRNPYGNVDRRNDAGNDTGDSEVERLNSQQLGQNYRGPYYTPGAPVPPPVPTGQPMYPSVQRGYYGR